MRRQTMLRNLGAALLVVIVLGVLAVGFVTRDRWRGAFDSEADTAAAEMPLPDSEPKVLKLSPQARRNLELVSEPVAPETYWRTIQVPGVVIDRPGLSDRGITSPAVGVVTKVHAFAGDTVRPGETLFTLRLFSEYLQNTQSELFKATGEITLIREERERLDELAQSGTIAGSRIIELDQQLRRQEGLLQAYRQDLLTRGLTPVQIDRISSGEFVSTIDVTAPPFADNEAAGGLPVSVPPLDDAVTDAELTPAEPANPGGGFYEMQELEVELGQQVQAGQLLGVLSNHQSLYIEGHAFKREASLLEQAAQGGWELAVEFADDDHGHWPDLQQTFQIRHLANTIDVDSRTFDFFVPLVNQSRTYEKGGETFVVWRFRPGQRVRLHVPVERLDDVLVVPAAAVAREGPETYVFQQNGDLFNRLSVQVLHEDRTHVVLADDDRLGRGVYLVQGSAATLNRVLKAQASSGMRADVHVHADGTVHAAH